MAHATELRTSPSATPSSMQDVFLSEARRSRVEVTLHLMDGRQLSTRIKGFDKFAILVDGESGGDQLIFKHAIASIESLQGFGNGIPSPHP